MEQVLLWLESNLEYFARIIVIILEFIGILVIVVGTIKAIFYVFDDTIRKKHHNVKITLAQALSLGLEFKMGAEIINTVVIREASELIILGAIILLRAILAIIIHWEIKTERKDEMENIEVGKVLKEENDTSEE